MKKLLSIILTVTLVLTMLSMPVTTFATTYEYLETFDSATNSFTKGNWTYNADAKNLSVNTSSQIAKFNDPEGVLANATNYEVSAEFTPTSQYDQNALVFKADSTYGTYIMFRRSGNYAEFYHMNPNKQLAIGTKTTGLLPNVANTIKVEVRGNTYKGYINGVEILSYTDTEATSNYNVGFRSNLNKTADANASVSIDNFSVTNLDKPTTYEYTDTFENANNWSGSGWSVADGKATAANASANVIYTFQENGGILTSPTPIDDYTISADFTTEKGNAGHAIVFRKNGNNFYMFRAGYKYVEFYKMGSGQGQIAKSADNTAVSSQAGDTYNLKVVVKGNTFTGYYNGIELLTVTDNTNTTGDIGVRANGTLSVDNFYVCRGDKPVLTEATDTFENDDNWTLGNWQYNSTNKNIEVSAASQIAEFKDNDDIIAGTNDYIISADFTTGVANGLHGIVFRRNGNNFYLFRPNYRYVEFFKLGSGQGQIAKSIETNAIAPKVGDTYNLKVVVSGNTFTGYYNGVKMLTVTDTTNTSGTIGVRSNGVVSVDNFYVARLDINAELDAINADGTLILGFKADVYDYTVDLGNASEYPVITASAVNTGLTEGNGITIVQPSKANNGTATITVVSANGNVTKTYTVKFSEPVIEDLDTFENLDNWTSSTKWTLDAYNNRMVTSESYAIIKYTDAKGIIAGSNNNYAVSSDFVFEGGTDVGPTSIMFKGQNDNNYYMFRINGRKAEFYRMGGTGNAAISSESNDVPNLTVGDVVNLKVVVRGNSFEGYVNGVKYATATDSEFADGFVGIRGMVAEGQKVYASNFYVCNANAEMKLLSVAVPDGRGALISPVPVNNKYFIALPDNNVSNIIASALNGTDTVTVTQSNDFNQPATITITNGVETATYKVYFVEKNKEIQSYAYCTNENGSNLTFKGAVLNTNDTVSGTAMLAAYDTETGKLIDVIVSGTKTFAGNYSVTDFDFGTIDIEGNAADIKVFLWSDASNVMPLSIASSFRYNRTNAQLEIKAVRDVVGVNAWGSVYRLDASKSQMQEMADEIAGVNSKSIKVYLGPKYKEQYLYEDFGDTEYANMVELAKAPQYANLFADERFDTIAMEAFEMELAYWQNGLARFEKEAVENEFYEFTKHLLTTYKNTNKTFILQNWEGDNTIQAWLDDNTDMSVVKAQNIKLEGYAQYMNARQAGVERAREEVGTEGVNVVNAFEVMAVPAKSINDDYYFVANEDGDVVRAPLMVELLIGNEPRVNPDGSKTYFTRVKADLYSISSWHTSFLNYESLQPDGSSIKITNEQMTNSMAERLNYMAERALPSDVFGYQNIMVGEFGAKEYYNPNNVDGQAETKKEIAKAQVESFMTVPQLQYAFYWQLFCNGIRDAENNAWYDGKIYSNTELDGGWLIRPNGTKPAIYNYFKDLLAPQN